jgi:hypothetical protein
MISSNSIILLLSNGRQMPSDGRGATVRRMGGFDSCRRHTGAGTRCADANVRPSTLFY